MPSSPRVAIIVLNYNGKDCLPACLESLSLLEYSNKEIIVVDNASSDDSFLVAEKKFPECTFVRNEKNEGFAKGMNSGIRLALSHGVAWCWLINYDAVVQPQTLTNLMAVAEKYPKTGLLSPQILEKESKKIWFAKGELDFFRMRAVHSTPTKKDFSSDAYRSEFLTGCALLIKRELIEAIGFLDERFFLYYEDVDYSLRATQAGFSCLVVPKALAWHSEASRMRSEKVYFLVYSGLLFFKKHASFLMRQYLFVYVTMRRVKNWFDRTYRRNGADLEVYRAYQHFFHGH